MDSTNGFLSQDFQLDEYGILIENIGEETASSDGQYQDSMNEEGILFDPTDPDESFLTYTSDTLPPGYPPFGTNSAGGVHDGFLSDGSDESLLEFQMTERASSQLQNGLRSNSDNEDPEMFMMEAILQEKQRAHEAYSRLLAEERATSRHAEDEEMEEKQYEEEENQDSNRNSQRSINGEVESLTRRRAELMTPDEVALTRDSADLEVEQELAWSRSDARLDSDGNAGVGFDHQFTPDFDQNLLDFEADDIGGGSNTVQQREQHGRAEVVSKKIDDARTSATLTPARLMQLQERLDRAASRNYNPYKPQQEDDGQHDLELVNPPKPLMDLGNDPIEVHDQLLRAMELASTAAPRVQDRRSRIHNESTERSPLLQNRQPRFHSQGRTPPRPSSTDSNRSSETVLQRGASVGSISTALQQKQHGYSTPSRGVQQKQQQQQAAAAASRVSQRGRSLTQGSTDGFSSCDSTDDLGSVVATPKNQNQSKGTLKKQLSTELATSRAKDQQIQELQSALNIMHRKYALSEVTIDQLRLGANVRLNMSYSASDLNHRTGVNTAVPFIADKSSSTALLTQTFPNVGAGDIRAHSVLERPMLTGVTDVSLSAALLDARSVSVPPSPMSDNLRHQAAVNRGAILNHEGTHMGLLMRAGSIKEQLIALAQALNDAHLTVAEQERLWGDIVAAKDQLQSEIQKAQILHNQFISSGILAPDSVFDPNANLDAELFDIMCRMDQLEPRIEENVRTFKRRTPFQQLNNGPSVAAAAAGLNLGIQKSMEVVAPPRQKEPDNWHVTPASPQQLMGYIIEAFDEIRDPELGAKLAVLEDEYLALMRRYNGIKALPATSARVSETGHLMSVLRNIAEEARGMSQVIGTREELEREFRLDAEARQLDSDLMAVQAEAEASRAGASAIRREASIGEDAGGENDNGHDSRTSFVSTDVFGMTDDLATTSDLSSKPSVMRRNRAILREEFDSRRQLRSQGERSFSGSMDSALSTPDSFSFTRTPPPTSVTRGARGVGSTELQSSRHSTATAFSSLKKGGDRHPNEKPPRYQTSDPDSGFIGSDSRHSLGMRAPAASPLVEQLTPSTTGTTDITMGDVGTNNTEANRIRELEQQVNWLAEQLTNKKNTHSDVAGDEHSFNLERYDLSSSLADSLASSGAEDIVSLESNKISRTSRGRVSTPSALDSSTHSSRSRQMPSVPPMRLPNADMSSDSELEELDRAQRRRQQQSVSSAGGTTSRNSSVPRSQHSSQRRDHRRSSNSTLGSAMHDPMDVELEQVMKGLQRNDRDSFNKSASPSTKTRRHEKQPRPPRPEMISSGTGALPARRLRKVGKRYGSDIGSNSSNSDGNSDDLIMRRVDGSTSDYEMPEFDYLEYSFKPRRRGEKANDGGHLSKSTTQSMDQQHSHKQRHVHSVTDSISSRASSCSSFADPYIIDERTQPHPCPTCGSRSGTPQLLQPRTHEGFRYPKSGPFKAVHHLSPICRESSPDPPMREYYDQTPGLRRYLVREYSTSNLVPRSSGGNQPVAPSGPMRAYPLAQPIVLSRQQPSFSTPAQHRQRHSMMTPPPPPSPVNKRTWSKEHRRHASMVDLSAGLSGASLLRKEVTVDAALKAARSMNRLALQLQHELLTNNNLFLGDSRSTLSTGVDSRSEYRVLRT